MMYSSNQRNQFPGTNPAKYRLVIIINWLLWIIDHASTMNNELRLYHMHPIEGATLQVQVQKQYLQFIRNRPDKGSWYNIKPSNASILNTVHYHLKYILLMQ